MDLSKADDCLRHDLSIAELEGYGLGNGSSSRLFLDYLTFWKKSSPYSELFWSSFFPHFLAFGLRPHLF